MKLPGNICKLVGASTPIEIGYTNVASFLEANMNASSNSTTIGTVESLRPLDSIQKCANWPDSWLYEGSWCDNPARGLEVTYHST